MNKKELFNELGSIVESLKRVSDGDSFCRGMVSGAELVLEILVKKYGDKKR